MISNIYLTRNTYKTKVAQRICCRLSSQQTRGEMLGLRVCKSIANPVTNSKFATICHICTRANS